MSKTAAAIPQAWLTLLQRGAVAGRSPSDWVQWSEHGQTRIGVVSKVLTHMQMAVTHVAVHDVDQTGRLTPSGRTYLRVTSPRDAPLAAGSRSAPTPCAPPPPILNLLASSPPPPLHGSTPASRGSDSAFPYSDASVSPVVASKAATSSKKDRSSKSTAGSRGALRPRIELPSFFHQACTTQAVYKSS